MGAALKVESLQDPNAWSEEDRARGRELGWKARSSRAATNKVLWIDHLTQKCFEAYMFNRTWPLRSALIQLIVQFNRDHGIKGHKKKSKDGQVDDELREELIEAWLTDEVIQEIYVEAVNSIRAAAKLDAQEERRT